jgi:hypothetical protein
VFGRVSRTAVDIFGTLVVLTAIALGVFGWRLSQGPISLAFLTPLIERALSRDDESLVVDVDDTVLAWAGWQRTLDLRLQGVHVFGPGGKLVLEVPTVSVSFSARAMLRGLVAPTTIDVVGLELHLLRGPDGVVRFGGLGAGSTSGDSSVATALLADLLGPPDPDRSLGYLRRVGVFEAGLTLVDEGSGRSWSARDGRITLARDEAGIRADLIATAELGGKPASLSAAGIYRPDTARLDVATRLTNVDSATLAEFDPVLAPLTGVHVPISGTVDIGFDPEFRIATARFEFTGDAGHINAASFNLAQDAPVRRFALRGTLPDGMRSVEIDEALLDLGGPVVTLKARLSGLGDKPRAEGSATARNVPTNELRRLWPRGVGENARVWITENLSNGHVPEAQAQFAAVADGSRWQVEKLTGTLVVRGVDVTYLRPMPPVRGVDGTATFTAKRFDIETRGGSVGQIKAGDGKIALYGLDTDIELADIALAITGPVREALTLVDGPPLGYLKKIDLKPQDFDGDAAVRLALKFPLKKTLKVEELDVVATAEVKRLTQKQAALGHDVRDGDVTLRVDRNGLDIKGKVSLGATPATIEVRRNFADNAPFLGRTRAQGRVGSAERTAFGFDFSPYVDGPTDLSIEYVERRGNRGEVVVDAKLDNAAMLIPDLEWAKTVGTPGSARGRVHLAGGRAAEITEFIIAVGNPASGGLSAAGGVTLADDGKTIAAVDLASLKTGLTDARGSYRRSAGGVAISVTGTSFDVGALMRDKSRPPERPPLELHVDLDRLYFAPDRALYAVRFDGQRSTERWEKADLTARTEEQMTLTNPVTLQLTQTNARQQLLIRTDDAGAFFKALDITPNVAGGRLQVAAATDESRAGRPLVGKLQVTSFRAVRAPLLARVLSVALLTGIVDSLTGEGIRFSGLEADFAFYDPRLEVSEAKASGPALGITAKGSIDVDLETIDLEGTIVPANALNRLPGYIPLIGEILTGGGGGVFAATYRVTGPLDDARVSVNPLSTLAPGFLRNLFGILGGPGTSPGGSTPPSERELERGGRSD